MVRKQFMVAMAALGYTPEYLHVKGNGVGFFNIVFVDKACPRARRNCRNSEDFSENGENLSSTHRRQRGDGTWHTLRLEWKGCKARRAWLNTATWSRYVKLKLTGEPL